jgi:hypothetical protein
VLPLIGVVFSAAVALWVTKMVDAGKVVYAVMVMKVVLATTRGRTAPRRTSAAVGMQDSVVVDFFVVVFVEMVETLMLAG